ncbi:hypothetical protein [Olleya sp. YS]|uniref:hypothetical protein n=1 Tax=Olleya sp. YS TaxID=3028318 RepID=UPI002434280E|nr:hypothetical protein [Olleya sp. YS]WGD36072.1 hypothetical protein Ollyesu_06545 [Olleya sp. YS]
MKHIMILLLFPLLTWSQSYLGHVGNYPIHLDIDLYPNNDDASTGEIDGYYFYDSKLISIPISGIYTNNTILLIDGYHYFADSENDADEVFNLKKDGDSLTGTLKLNEDIYNVVLTKTEEDPLEDFRNPKLTFVRDSVTNYQNKQLVWFHEKYSKTEMFRLGNGFTKAQQDTFNPLLEYLHLENAIDIMDCNSWFEIDFTIHLVNNNFISFSKQYSVFCGGAHPSYGTIGYTYDLKTLKQVKDLDTLYPDIDFFKLLKDKYYDATDEHQEECEIFTEPSHWNNKTWNLTPKGVLLIPNYPYAMSPCEEDYFLPYTDITKD